MHDRTITREHAVLLVERWLERERVLEQRVLGWAQDLGVSSVAEHEFGWLVNCGSRSGGTLPAHGPFLVDGVDGRLHQVPVVGGCAGWEAEYRHEVRGLPRPDPLTALVREALASGGRVAALRALRSAAPGLPLGGARAHVDAVQAGGEPRLPEGVQVVPATGIRPRPVPVPTGAGLPGPRPDAPYGRCPDRPLGTYRELAPADTGAPGMLRVIRGEPAADEPRLTGYLRAGACLVAATVLTRDVLDPAGQPLQSWGLCSDGAWFWRADLAHYVERYHLRLPPAFLEHAAANGWVPPCPDERQTDALLGDAGSG